MKRKKDKTVFLLLLNPPHVRFETAEMLHQTNFGVAAEKKKDF